MGKLKTKKSVVRRFKFTKKGKIKYKSCGKRHMMSHKKTKRKRGMRKSSVLADKKKAKYLKRLVPYGR